MNEHTGTMIALHLSAEDAEPLAIEGGEDAADLHATLAYLKADDNPEITREGVEAVLREVMGASDIERLEGIIGGIGRFSASPTSDEQDVIYASLDLPGLAGLRTDLVRGLSASGLRVASDHDFTPHMTLSYIPTHADTPMTRIDAQPVSFDGLAVTVGDERGELLPFGAAKSIRRDRVRRAAGRVRVKQAARRSLVRRVKRVTQRVGSIYQRGAPVKLKAVSVDRDARRVEGFIATVRDPFSSDRDQEVFDGAAFLSTIKRFNEGAVIPKIGDDHGRSVGVWDLLEMRTKGGVTGLWGSGLIDEGPEGDAVLIKHASGSYDSLSPGFFPLSGYLHPTATGVSGKPVAVITDIDMFEASLTGTPIDPAARVAQKAVRSMKVLKSVCGGARYKGAALAELLETKIALILEEDGELTRADVVEAVASQAGIEAGTVNEILSAQIDQPPMERLEAFADVLGLPMSQIEAALARDVEAAGEGEEEAAEKAIVEEDVESVDSDRVSLKAAEELRGIAADLEGLASRLRRLSAEADDGEEEIVEISDDDQAGAEIDIEIKSAARSDLDGARLDLMLAAAERELETLKIYD